MTIVIIVIVVIIKKKKPTISKVLTLSQVLFYGTLPYWSFRALLWGGGVVILVLEIKLLKFRGVKLLAQHIAIKKVAGLKFEANQVCLLLNPMFLSILLSSGWVVPSTLHCKNRYTEAAITPSLAWNTGLIVSQLLRCHTSHQQHSPRLFFFKFIPPSPPPNFMLLSTQFLLKQDSGAITFFKVCSDFQAISHNTLLFLL